MEATQYELTTALNDHIEDRPMWVAEMESRIKIFQDDDMPGLSEPSAWKRLGRYVRETGDWIVRLRLQFYSHMIWIPSSDLGYYFAKGAGLFVAATSTPIDFFSVGRMMEENHVVTKQYKTPELVYMGEAPRTVEESGERLIQNPKKT